jgi:hypothetical protein
MYQDADSNGYKRHNGYVLPYLFGFHILQR